MRNLVWGLEAANDELQEKVDDDGLVVGSRVGCKCDFGLHGSHSPSLSLCLSSLYPGHSRCLCLSRTLTPHPR